jgi:hypothetical protein
VAAKDDTNSKGVDPGEPDADDKPAGKSMKLGGGGRFAALKAQLADKKGVKQPGALAAYIGREKYGAKKMGKMAAKAKA